MVVLFNFPSLVSILRNHELISKIEDIRVDEIAQRGFYKMKCRLIPSKYRLEIKFIKTHEEFIYAYRLYSTTTIVRWDNAPHYPGISTYPHHFHDLHGNVLESDLTGEAGKDLILVLSKIRKILV
ncbi:MAG: hypothetical protein KAW12_01625 [Candidatus Aminicenantes bacterium]|nr:hypothetical protein [Candidatus Aminicenantes bacterium]